MIKCNLKKLTSSDFIFLLNSKQLISLISQQLIYQPVKRQYVKCYLCKARNSWTWAKALSKVNDKYADVRDTGKSKRSSTVVISPATPLTINGFTHENNKREIIPHPSIATPK